MAQRGSSANCHGPRRTLSHDGRKGDTIWMGAIDGNGLAVSYIQSIYWEYGSGCVLPQTGVLLQNRGVSFSLDAKAKNPLEPGRRPFHTLNPPMAVFRDGRICSYGAMGGDGQPQFQAQIFTRWMMGQPIAEALGCAALFARQDLGFIQHIAEAGKSFR